MLYDNRQERVNAYLSTFRYPNSWKSFFHFLEYWKTNTFSAILLFFSAKKVCREFIKSFASISMEVYIEGVKFLSISVNSMPCTFVCTCYVLSFWYVHYIYIYTYIAIDHCCHCRKHLVYNIFLRLSFRWYILKHL